MDQPGKQILTATGKLWRFGAGRKFEYFIAATMCQHLFELYKRSLLFSVHGAWHSPNTIPAIVHGQDFRLIILKTPYPSPGGPKGGGGGINHAITLKIWQNHASRLDIWIFHAYLHGLITVYCEGLLGVSYICRRPYCDICMCSFIVGFCCLVIWQFLIAARL